MCKQNAETGEQAKETAMTCKTNYRKLVLILGLAGFVSAADNWFVSPSLPAIATSFGVSVAAAGGILTAYMIPYGLMQPVYGYFGDRYDKIRLLFVIVIGLALGTAGSALSNSLVVLCVLRVITGFFAAGIIAVSLSVIGDVVSGKEQQTYVGEFMGIVFAGQGLSCGLGGMLTKYVSWRGAFLFFAVAALVSALLLKRLSAHPTERVGGNRDFFRQTLAAVKSRKGRVIFPLAFVTGFLLLGMYGYLGAFLHERVNFDYMQAGIVVMFYGFACLSGGMVVGRLADRHGKQTIVVAGECMAVIAAALLVASYMFHSWPFAFAATVCLGFGYIAIQSTLATMAFYVAGNCRGLPSGLIGLCLFCGGGLGSLVAGRLLALYSYNAIWAVFGAAVVLETIITSRLDFDDGLPLLGA